MDSICAPDLLPRLLDATGITVVVTSSTSEATDLTTGTLVTVGTIYAYAETISGGGVEAREMMAMYGEYGVPDQSRGRAAFGSPDVERSIRTTKSSRDRR